MDPRQRETLAAADWARGRHGHFKSRERVRDLAEVYTHEREVKAMLDLVPDMFPSAGDLDNIDRTFLEPACGHGNFLAQILHRKLRYVTSGRYGRGERFEHMALRCIASVYGIDISDDNVRESRERLRSAMSAHVESHLGGEASTTGFRDAIQAILETNIIRADTLGDAARIELVEYRPGSGGTFIREWSHLDPAANAPNLFSLARRRDEVPVHYFDLRGTPAPVTHNVVKGEAA
ncbi:MAG: type III restriction endonuclease subunit M [Solirubrobacteraceae bacterium]